LSLLTVAALLFFAMTVIYPLGVSEARCRQ